MPSRALRFSLTSEGFCRTLLKAFAEAFCFLNRFIIRPFQAKRFCSANERQVPCRGLAAAGRIGKPGVIPARSRRCKGPYPKARRPACRPIARPPPVWPGRCPNRRILPFAVFRQTAFRSGAVCRPAAVFPLPWFCVPLSAPPPCVRRGFFLPAVRSMRPFSEFFAAKEVTPWQKFCFSI